MAMEGRSADLDLHIGTYLSSPSHRTVSIMDILVDFKAEGRTLVHMAASGGHVAVLQALLKRVAGKPNKHQLANLADDRCVLR